MFGWSCLCFTSCFVLSLRCSLTSGSILVHPSGWSRIESRFIIHRSHTSHTSHTATYFCFCIFLDLGVIQHGWQQPDQHETFCSTAPRPAAIRQSRFWMPGCSLNLQGSLVFRLSTHKIPQTERLGKNQGFHVLGLCQLCDVVISWGHYGFNLMQTYYAKQIPPWELRLCEVSIYLDAPVVAKNKQAESESENMSRRRDGGYVTSNPI